jgi:hypothetical protein
MPVHGNTDRSADFHRRIAPIFFIPTSSSKERQLSTNEKWIYTSNKVCGHVLCCIYGSCPTSQFHLPMPEIRAPTVISAHTGIGLNSQRYLTLLVVVVRREIERYMQHSQSFSRRISRRRQAVKNVLMGEISCSIHTSYKQNLQGI